jgi:hypothetical protein
LTSVSLGNIGHHNSDTSEIENKDGGHHARGLANWEQVGNKFPDIELPDTSGTVVKLSELMKGLPTVLTFNRGKY